MNNDEINNDNDDLLGFDAVIDITDDGDANVTEAEDSTDLVENEAAEDNAESSENLEAENNIDSHENADTEESIESTENLDEESSENTTDENDSESAEKVEAEIVNDKSSFEEKINSGAESVKNFFSGFASKISKKADDLQAKEKFEKFAGTVSDKVSSVVSKVEDKFTKDKKDESEDNTENNEESSVDSVVDDSNNCNGMCETCDGCENESSEDEEIEKVEGHIVGTIEDKYDQLKQKVSSVAKKIGPKVSETAKTIGPKVAETAKTIGPKVAETAKTIGPKVTEAAKKVGPKVKETAEVLGPKFKSKAKNVAENVSFQGYRLKSKVKKKVKNKVKEAVIGKTDDDGENIRAKKVKKYSSNFMNHAATVINHRNLVIKHCFKAGIPLQGLTHDLSKFSPAEFKYGIKYFRGDRSPNEGEREDYGYSNAWMHHKGRNKHHFEYWTDYNIEANKVMPVKMPLKYVIEMFCDRVAAGKIYKKEAYTNQSPYEYFDKGRARRTLHQETSDFLEKLLKMLAAKGEEYTFTYIRWYMKHHKDY